MNIYIQIFFIQLSQHKNQIDSGKEGCVFLKKSENYFKKGG